MEYPRGPIDDRLHDAAVEGNLDSLAALLDAGADPNTPDAFGFVPLMWAALADRPDAARLLVESGANPNLTLERVGVDIPFDEGRWKAEYYVTAGSPVSGETALGMAAIRGFESVVRVLVEAGANLNLGGGRGGLIRHAMRGRRCGMALWLLRAGAPYDDPVPSRSSELSCLVLFCDADTALEFLEHVAQMKGDLGWFNQSWFLAADYNRADIMSVLLERGYATIDKVDPEGRTALSIAAFNGNGNTVRMLLARGAQVDRRNPRGETVLLLATTKGLPEGCGNNEPWTEAEEEVESRRYCDVVTTLLKACADPNATRDDGKGPLAVAAGCWDDVSLVRLLLDAGADASAKDTDGNTALDAAMLAGHCKVAELLTAATEGLP